VRATWRAGGYCVELGVFCPPSPAPLRGSTGHYGPLRISGSSLPNQAHRQVVFREALKPICCQPVVYDSYRIDNRCYLKEFTISTACASSLDIR
jgi:hypothetical protein